MIISHKEGPILGVPSWDQCAVEGCMLVFVTSCGQYPLHDGEHGALYATRSSTTAKWIGVIVKFKT